MAVTEILCVYGADHKGHITGLLVPALLNQTVAGSIRLNLLNYNGNDPLIRDHRYGRMEVRDWSASRGNARIGFGEGINYLFERIKPPRNFLIINPDTVPDHAMLKHLEGSFEHGVTGIVEARQWPAEHPKEYDRATGRTPWASGACALVCSETFESVGGFDPVYFLYCEDVDLSWRVWLAKREVVYQPKAVLMHNTGLFAYRSGRFYYEHFYSARNFIALCYKFFGNEGEGKALRLFKRVAFPENFKAEVRSSYERIKPSIHSFTSPPDHEMIMVKGYNVYHRFQKTS